MPLCADLVIIDCGFKDDLGLNLLTEIKSRYPGIPVILITDAGSEVTAVAAFRTGARDYIKKPINLMEFRDAVIKFLSLKRSATLGNRRQFLPDLPADAAKATWTSRNDLPANLLRAMQFVKDNFTRPITIDQISHEAGFCKCHFCREFKKSTGMTPLYFLSVLRVTRSQELLKAKIPVSTIAMKVGFRDLSSFNRHFKKITGLTPSAYRKSVLQGL